MLIAHFRNHLCRRLHFFKFSIIRKCIHCKDNSQETLNFSWGARIFNSFLLLDIIPSYGYTTVYLFTLWRTSKKFPHLSLLGKVAITIHLQGLGGTKFASLWNKYLGVQLLGYVIVKKLQNSFQSCTILHSHQLCMSDPVSLNICLTLVV